MEVSTWLIDFSNCINWTKARISTLKYVKGRIFSFVELHVRYSTRAVRIIHPYIVIILVKDLRDRALKSITNGSRFYVFIEADKYVRA